MRTLISWPRLGFAALGAVGMMAALAYPASADIIDPLHGVCNGTGSGTCIDNGTNTPLGNSTTFGFTISPGPQTGSFTLIALVPNNDSFSGSVTGTLPTSQTVSFTQVDTAWTTGTLATVVGIDASPDNPIGPFLP